MGLKEEFDRLGKEVEKVVKDLTTLTVVTLTGDVKATAAANGDWSIANGAQADVVASTTVKLDGDITTIVPAASGKPDKDWMDVHAASVKAATEGRAALVKSIADMVRSFV